MISTKGRYSIRILLDLAEHRGVGYTPIKDVAARQSISLKYVEKLMPALKIAGLLDSSHGIGGGKAPEAIRFGGLAVFYFFRSTMAMKFKYLRPP